MNNIIFIEGGAYADVRKALKQWISNSSGTLIPGLSFELYKNGRGYHIIWADRRLENEQFNYLLNYLKYPEDIDYKIEIAGYTNISVPTVFPSNRIGENILVFIPSSDNEYDNVYWVTKDNRVYKTGFSGKTLETELRKSYEETEFLPAECPPPEILYTQTLKENEPELEGDEERGDSSGKRFKILAILTIALMILAQLFYNNPSTFLQINSIIGIGVAVWFFSDYKLLRKNKFFNLSFVLALVIVLYGYIIRHSSNTLYKFVGNIEFTMALPVVFLVVQKPLRIAFKSIMKREPVIEKPIPSFADFLYVLLLFALLAIAGLLFPQTPI